MPNGGFAIPSDVRGWARGLIAAAVGSAANAVTTMVVAPATFNLQAGLPKLLEFMAVSAIVSMAAYLKQDPLPGGSDGK